MVSKNNKFDLALACKFANRFKGIFMPGKATPIQKSTLNKIQYCEELYLNKSAILYILYIYIYILFVKNLKHKYSSTTVLI